MADIQVNHESQGLSPPPSFPSQDHTVAPASASSPLFAAHSSPRSTATATSVPLLKNPPRIRSSTVAPDRAGAKYYQPPVVHSAMLKEATGLDKRSDGSYAKLHSDKVVTEVMSKMTLQPSAPTESSQEAATANATVTSQSPQDAVSVSIDEILKKDLDVRSKPWPSLGCMSDSTYCCRLALSFSWIA